MTRTDYARSFDTIHQRINSAEQIARLSPDACAHGLLDLVRVAREVLERLDRIEARVSALETRR